MGDDNYTNGFNDAYEMAQVDPEMSAIISDTSGGLDTDYALGWRDGIEQCELDQKIEWAQELEDLRNNDKQDKDQER